MNRQHPIFSPIAIISTLLLLASLGVGLYQSGGQAFSPGELSAVNASGQRLNDMPHHAAFGQDCTQCHAPFQGIEANRCENCHVTIGEQRVVGMGLHGRLQTSNCALCHSEHLGADFTSGAEALAQFTATEHTRLFPLVGAHEEVACINCHANEQYINTPRDCVGCHAEPDLHQGLLSTNCAQCHTENGWRPAQLTAHLFDLNHSEGEPIACATCHTITFNDFTCTACHADSDMNEEHKDLNLLPEALADCAACHQTGNEDEAEQLIGLPPKQGK